MYSDIDLGAVHIGEGRCSFKVWAPYIDRMEVHVVHPHDYFLPLNKDANGYFSGTFEGVFPGTEYLLRLNGKDERPDPASRYQPKTVHGPSAVVDGNYEWRDSSWQGLALCDYVIYELHVGTFTPDGTFEAIIPRLPELRDLGVNNIEIMPVSQFPGSRNWGYDGVLPFAVQNSYGGPEGFKRLVDACHEQGIAVTLDVVYNHFGPEGNYLREFGPYFTHRYRTPWGDALNFDDERNDFIREYFIQNALYWFRDYHVDALRLDAVHAIYDMSAFPFLTELTRAVDSFSECNGRKRHLIAESDLNDARLLRSRDAGGYGLHSQWSDDFHHALHSLLTGEREGYYQDFGTLEHLVIALRDRFYYSWKHAPSRGRRHGNPAGDRPAEQFVISLQNHDQIGNRMLGERLSSIASFEAQKLGAGALLLAPYVPMLYMGQEYGEEAPFLYFISHSDEALTKAVREGRKEEFKAFSWLGEAPNADDPETFERSRLSWENKTKGKGKILYDLHKQLISMRRNIPALKHLDAFPMDVRGYEEKMILVMVRRFVEEAVLCVFNFGKGVMNVPFELLNVGGNWLKLLDSADEKWGGSGSGLPGRIASGAHLDMKPQSFVVYEYTGPAPE